MNREEIFNNVKQIISDQLNISKEQITLDSKFMEDLNADSLDIYELLYTLEGKFGEKIPEDQANDFQTVADIVNFIESKQK